jgi:hypothetical protein
MSFEDELEAFFDEVEDVIVEESEQHEPEDHKQRNQQEDDDADDHDRGDITDKASTSEPEPKRTRMTEESSTMPVIKAIVASSAPTVNKSTLDSRQNVSSTSKGYPSDTTYLSNRPTTTNYTQVYGNMIHPPIMPIVQQAQEQRYPSMATSGKVIKRSAAGQVWEDPSLAEFPENDFRCFVGNLGKDVSDVKLAEAFSGKYPSFVMARVVFDKATKQSKGYGFVSFMDPTDCAKALREMDKSWIGSRPVQMKLSDWKSRDWKEVHKRDKTKIKRNK